MRDCEFIHLLYNRTFDCVMVTTDFGTCGVPKHVVELTTYGEYI